MHISYLDSPYRFLLAGMLALTVLAGCRKTVPVPQPAPPEETIGLGTDNSGITYQLLVYSFADSDGDRIGDFNGIAAHLDHIADLGATAIWLSPIHPASSYHGYDVEDYYGVNPEYGTEQDFKNLVDAAHRKGIKIYLDFILNHTSKFHPWFTEALSNEDSKYRDYYFIYPDGSYKCVFGEWMPDLNYGPSASCEDSPAFKELAGAAEKWIKLGVDGFRLDAVKHIYDNGTNDDNPSFLRKFYDHCNSVYKALGHTDDIYMVGEHFSEAGSVAPYYRGLPGFFEFSFWWRLVEGINNGKGKGFAQAIKDYRDLYAGYRSDYIAATKLTNHDEDRAGELLGKDTAKEKLAAAVLLTAPGNPYIYQGEELGYWGSKAGGDEYVRAPIRWSASNSKDADGKLLGKICAGMLTPERSVESQRKSISTLLGTYRSFGHLRSQYSALSVGDFTPRETGNETVAAWYRSYKSQKVLVLHNFSDGGVTLSFMQDKLDNMLGSAGAVTIDNNLVTLEAYSSAVFLQ